MTKIFLYFVIGLLSAFIVSSTILKFTCPQNTVGYHDYATSTNNLLRSYYGVCEKLGFSDFSAGPGPIEN